VKEVVIMTLTLEKNMIVPQVPTRKGVGKYINMLKLAHDPFKYMYQLRHEYGDMVKMPGSPMTVTFVFSPEYTRTVLTDTTTYHNGEADKLPFKVPKDSAFSRLAKTMNTINGEKHRQQRKLIMPAFHRKRVETYRDDMVALIEGKLKEWQSVKTLDFLKEMKQLTMAVAVKTLLGLDPVKEGDRTRNLVERWIFAGSSPLGLLLPFNIPGLPFYNSLKLAGEVEAEFKNIIARKRRENNDDNSALAMMQQAHDEDGTRLTDEELVSQTLALFVAGHETTATALTWTLFLLSQHPEVYRELVQELESKLGGSAPTVEQVNQLPYLEKVINESMRILSPFLWGFRLTTEATEIGEYQIPKNEIVAFAPALVHHDSRIYNEPKRFIPSRWDSINPTPYEYLPFSSGSRMCIGATFALMEMKLVLAMILQKYRFALVPESKIERTGFILGYPKYGLPLEVYKQDYYFVKNSARGNFSDVVTI
jgi:cytochrome P450